MRLTTLSLKNFRGFTSVEQVMDLNHDVILLYGRNASGKTSIFDAIELLLTGSMRRLQHITNLPEVLINARNPEIPAHITLALSSDSTMRFAEAQIHSTSGLAVNYALSRVESDLFQHATYLQQSDIRRLVTSDSAGLGDIIRSLALDDNVFRLEQALGEAGISRSTRGYVVVTRKIDALEQESRKLQERIDSAQAQIAAMESLVPDFAEWNIALLNAASKLGSSVDVEDNEALVLLDAGLQEKLKSALEAKQKAEELTRQIDWLIEQKKLISNSEQQLNDLETQRNLRGKELSECDTAISALGRELNDAAFVGAVGDARLALIAALEHIQKIKRLDVCPVCDQSLPNLPSHISSKLAKLRSEQSSAQEAVRKLKAGTELEVAKKKSLTKDLGDLDIQIQSRKSEVIAFEHELNRFVEPFKGTLGTANSLDEIGELLGKRELSSIDEILELTRLADALAKIRSSINASRIRSADLRAELAKAKNRIETISAKLSRAEEAKRRLELFIETAQEARRLLSSGVDDVIREFVMGRAKDTFEDLFRRLAKNPFFEVTVSGVRVKRHKPEVDWCAVYEKHNFPGEAVFSQGELNSCAIAFFLALATSHLGATAFAVR